MPLLIYIFAIQSNIQFLDPLIIILITQITILTEIITSAWSFSVGIWPGLLRHRECRHQRKLFQHCRPQCSSPNPHHTRGEIGSRCRHRRKGKNVKGQSPWKMSCIRGLWTTSRRCARTSWTGWAGERWSWMMLLWQHWQGYSHHTHIPRKTSCWHCTCDR